MSKFLSKKFEKLEPYVPGEQPQDQQYIKLNTNESPFPPSTKVQKAVALAAGRLQRYPDPDGQRLKVKIAEYLSEKENVILTKKNLILSNGSDEVLNFAFMAYCDIKRPAIFPDITYGFYPVFAEVNGLPYQEIPLGEDFQINPKDYYNAKGTVIIANPNAHTGMCLNLKQIEDIIKNNPDNVVIIDEAYVDFGTKSCISLIGKYENLLVVQTLSKSRSLAGGRLGFAVGNEKLIEDLDTIRNSTNPYNINSMTMEAGVASFEDEEYTKANCQTIIDNRKITSVQLKKMGFQLTDSRANFIFMKHPQLSGSRIYEVMKQKGVLIRHFNKERIKEFNRVTIGSREQMDKFIDELKMVLEELK